MSATATGAVVGAALAFAALLFGFWGFVLTVVFAGVGALVGRIIAGELDVRGLADVLTGRRTS